MKKGQHTDAKTDAAWFQGSYLRQYDMFWNQENWAIINIFFFVCVIEMAGACTMKTDQQKQEVTMSFLYKIAMFLFLFMK